MTGSHDRIAIVTGAARGIGAATVRRLSAAGYHVVAVDACLGSHAESMAGVTYPMATMADLDSVVATYPDRITPAVCDVRQASELISLAEETIRVRGRIDAAVACAGVIAGGETLWRTPESTFRTLLDVDVLGVWNTASAVLPQMLDNPSPAGSRFVAVASAAGDHGLLHLTAYTAAKHAVVGLVRGLAADLQGTGVTAVAVSPGSTDTPMLDATASIYGLSSAAELGQRQLLRRVLTPDEVAATIEFCCSEEAVSLNGSVVAASGGFIG